VKRKQEKGKVFFSWSWLEKEYDLKTGILGRK
jgi:hypothetical protein